MNLDDLWARLERWLSEHCKELDGALRPGASPNKIEAIEQHLGFSLPEQVRSFYGIHDGQTESSPELFDGFRFLPLDDLFTEWSMWKDDPAPKDFETESASANTVKPVWWNARWLPFAANGCGDNHAIDLDPNPEGEYGQIIGIWLAPPDRNLLSASLTDWFSLFVIRVENGEFHYCEDMDGFVEIEDDE